MRVFADAQSGQVIIEGSRTTWAPETLMASREGDAISIWLRGEMRRVAGPTAFANIRTIDNSGFGSVGDAMAYLDNLFAIPDFAEIYRSA